MRQYNNTNKIWAGERQYTSPQHGMMLDREQDWKALWSTKREVNSQLLKAAAANQTDRCAELLKVKGDGRPDINAKDQLGNTCLHIAVQNDNVQLVSFLLFHQAMIDPVNREQRTPLMMACVR